MAPGLFRVWNGPVRDGVDANGRWGLESPCSRFGHILVLFHAVAAHSNDYVLSDIEVTRNGPVIVPTYFVTTTETIAGERLSKKRAARAHRIS